MDPALRFTDSWGLTWWVYEEHSASSVSLGGGVYQPVHQRSRLCFSTDLVTRSLEHYPVEWWTLAPERLEALCCYATPSAHHPPPGTPPATHLVARPRRALGMIGMIGMLGDAVGEGCHPAA